MGETNMIIHDLPQGTIEWLQFRAGKITGTRLKKILSKDNLPLIDELISEIETGIDDDDAFISEEMQRGLDLEPIALEAYTQATGNELTRYGLLQSSEIPMLCQSPDAYVGNTGAVEVKCLKTKNHIRLMRMDKVPSEYIHQVWCYFLVNPDLQWLDFVSYDPRLTKRPLWIKRIDRSDVEADLTVARQELLKFIEKFNTYYDEIFF